MNEQEQHHHVELTVTIDEQVHTHRFDTLDPAAVPDYIQQTKQMSQELEVRRSQIWGEQVQAQPQVAVQAQPQLQPPVQAPPEETYKERKARVKAEKEALKAGKIYTPNASLQTARLMQLKAANDPNGTGPEGLPDGMDTPALEEAVKRVTEVKITPDMFMEERFALESVTLRRALYEYKSLDRIMAGNPAFFTALKQSDPLRAKKLEHCKAMAKPLENMLIIASGTCGITVEGEAIEQKSIVEHARRVRGEQLVEFAQKLLNENTAYAGEIENYIDQRVAQKTPEYDQRREDFRRQYIEDNPDSAWIDVPAFNYPPQYESLEKLRHLMQKHGDVYLQHKALFDAMLEDVTHSLETYALLKAQSSVLDEIQGEMLMHEQSKLDSKRAAAGVTKRMDKLMADSYEVVQRFENVNDAMKVLLRGRKLNGLNVAVLSQFGFDVEPQFRQRTIDDASTCGARSRWQNETLERLLQNPRVHVGDHTSQFVKRSASMFRQDDDDYNIALLNNLEQVKALGDGVPDKDFYDRTRQLLQPYVQKVLDWNVERALRMSDEELAEVQPQLDALFCDNMFVADLLKTKHWRGTYTMKNELLGDRIYEFGHKAAVLRALAEKSRGLALRRATKLGDLPEGAFSVIEWHDKVKTRDGIAPFIEQRIDIGNRLLEAEGQKQRDMEDVNSEAFKKKCKEQIALGVAADSFFLKGKFKAVENELQAAYRKFKNGEPLTEEEQKLAHAMKRVEGESYRLAGYTPEEAERDGMPPNIKEAVFRAFGRFTESESGMQLTPEQFKQMVLDLGAGYGMKQGETPPDELAAAREQNMRGIARYKECMRVQYDFLARKYGTKVESLSVKYVSDHYMEIMRDFADLQVNTSMMSRLPGFFDMNNPEDERLMHQAEYYCLMGAHAMNQLNYYANMGMDQQFIDQTAAGYAQSDQLAAHRQYLLDHTDDCSFRNVLNPKAEMQRQRGLDG